MRVVGGVWRGRRLAAPAGCATRPTSDLVREAIFDVLSAMAADLGAADHWAVGSGSESAAVGSGSESAAVGSGSEFGAVGSGSEPLAGLAVLDLFAGSGALGIEGLSRGASSCAFVERMPAAVRVLRENLARVGAPAQVVHVRATDYRRALKADAACGRLYNLVLVDAPYALYPAVEPELAGRLPAVLSPGAVVVVETAKDRAVSLPLVERSVKMYGDTRVTFLQARS